VLSMNAQIVVFQMDSFLMPWVFHILMGERFLFFLLWGKKCKLWKEKGSTRYLDYKHFPGMLSTYKSFKIWKLILLKLYLCTIPWNIHVTLRFERFWPRAIFAYEYMEM
jgi:hypothetical protein